MNTRAPPSPRIARSRTRAVIAAIGHVWPAVFEQRGAADRALADFLRAHPEFGGRDRRLIGDMVFGLLRWWGWLRTSAAPLLAAPDPQADTLLPAWARVLTAVAALEGATHPDVQAFWLAAAGATAPPPPTPAALADWLGVAGACAPSDLIPDWAAAEIACPHPLTELIDWLQRRPPLWLRIQHGSVDDAQRELAAAGLAAAPHPGLRAALAVRQARVNLATLPAYREGRLEVQDLASQAVGEVCAAQPGERWLDACAGAGGKTLQLARDVGPAGSIVARDVRRPALDELVRRARRAGFANVSAATAIPPDTAFDGVLVDAPCTGSGTWRRNPWSRWQLGPGDITAAAHRQLELLQNAACHVRPGGVLVYATCSLFTRENAGVATAFGAARPEFTPAPVLNPLTQRPAAGTVQFWPWDGDNDALFAARWLRR